MHLINFLQKEVVLLQRQVFTQQKLLPANTAPSYSPQPSMHLFQQALSLLTSKSCSSQYFHDARSFLIHSFHGHKHAVHAVDLINQHNLLRFPSDHFHRDMTHSQVQSVKDFAQEKTGKDVCCSKYQLKLIERGAFISYNAILIQTRSDFLGHHGGRLRLLQEPGLFVRANSPD